MPLSWNEIKSRALAFTQEWKDEVSEHAEAQSFWNDFFNVFGISRRRVATFEHQVSKVSRPKGSGHPSPPGRLGGANSSPSGEDGRGPSVVCRSTGRIDLLWKGVILIEHKSRGRDLAKAHQQAKDYFPGLTEKELPRYILVSDFERFNLYDLEENTQHEFPLTKLQDHVHLFGFIAGYQKRTYKDQDPVNIEAAELMGQLHDKLKDIGYEGHKLELYLVRLVFLLFADDTNIWEKGILYDYLEQHTKEDGSDLAAHIMQLFEVLNTAPHDRLKNLDESLAAFPYINGKLFEERLPVASFDSKMRKTLMDSCLLDWGKISPAIFGSLFQSVMDAKARRNLGAHYTSEKNILKLIKPLFLDELTAEFQTIKSSKAKLKIFHDKISSLRFLDPACGCGNFLIIAYRELRLLEIEIIKQRLKLEGYREEVTREARMDISTLVQCDVDRFYGIEYEEFPAQIAQVAMWLIDHQMNQEVSNTFGNYYVRLPLRKSATILHGNALRTDWQSLIEPIPWEKKEAKYDYILGNPPFIGKSLMNAEQKKDMENIFHGVKGAGVLDYVTAWYLKAAAYMQEYNKIPVSQSFPKSRDESSKANKKPVSLSLSKTIPKPTTNEIKKKESNLNLNAQSLTKAAFVSTNSISQGEQVGILWNELFNHYKIKIHFAHRTFSWSNEAKGNAAVHVVIIGFGNFDVADKKIFEYENIKGEPHELIVKNINPYLVEGDDSFLPSRKKPICNVPDMLYGNKIVDGGNYLFTDNEMKDFIKTEPSSKDLFKPILSGDEFLNGKLRWVLYLEDAAPSLLKLMPFVKERIENVKKYREQSTKRQTRESANQPRSFTEPRQPKNHFLLIPRTSSENRNFIPLGFFTKDFIVNDSCTALPNATIFHFGILTSTMHMVWMRNTCGRLKSDYRYSNSLVYNNFPWPENPSPKQIQTVEAAAQQVLDARAQFPEASLADLYDPNTMPPVLVKAHQALDKAVDLCYRPQAFTNETKRIEFLFELYDRYVGGMFAKEKLKRKK